MLKKVTLLAGILALTLSSVAFAEENKDKVSSVQLEQKRNKFDEKAVASKVISLEINWEREPDTYLFKCIGSVTNTTTSVLKNVKVKVLITDNEKNAIEEVYADTIDRLEPSEEKPFKIERYIATKTNQFNIRAMAKVVSLEDTNTIQVAEWILQGKKENLVYWDVRFSEPDFQSDTNLRNYAIRTLSEIKETDKDYNRAQDLINELKYVEGLKSLETNDYNNAFLHLTSVNPNRVFGDKAEKAIVLFRPKMLYEKAKVYIATKNYTDAIPLLRAIPPKTEYYNIARKELINIHFYLTHNDKNSSKTFDLTGYTDDQSKIVKLMEAKPEIIYNDFPAKNVTTWVFPDYSRFQFDFEGKLVGYKLYPLF